MDPCDLRPGVRGKPIALDQDRQLKHPFALQLLAHASEVSGVAPVLKHRIESRDTMRLGLCVAADYLPSLRLPPAPKLRV